MTFREDLRLIAPIRPLPYCHAQGESREVQKTEMSTEIDSMARHARQKRRGRSWHNQWQPGITSHTGRGRDEPPCKQRESTALTFGSIIFKYRTWIPLVVK